MTKIEIEGKCCHGHSNHESKVNAVIPIQIIKHVDVLFLREKHNMNKKTDCLHVFPATVIRAIQVISNNTGTEWIIYYEESDTVTDD
jgi:hypothetical protein